MAAGHPGCRGWGVSALPKKSSTTAPWISLWPAMCPARAGAGARAYASQAAASWSSALPGTKAGGAGAGTSTGVAGTVVDGTRRRRRLRSPSTMPRAIAARTGCTRSTRPATVVTTPGTASRMAATSRRPPTIVATSGTARRRCAVRQRCRWARPSWRNTTRPVTVPTTTTARTSGHGAQTRSCEMTAISRRGAAIAARIKRGNTSRGYRLRESGRSHPTMTTPPPPREDRSRELAGLLPCWARPGHPDGVGAPRSARPGRRQRDGAGRSDRPAPHGRSRWRPLVPPEGCPSSSSPSIHLASQTTSARSTLRSASVVPPQMP